MRQTAGCFPLLAVLVLSGCGTSGKDKRRNAVNAYLNRVDIVQQHFAPSFKLANDAYREFGKKKATPRELQRLRAAEVAILAARQEIERITPPPDARKLHAQLLELYNLNAEIGLEVITLQQFLPGVRTVLGQLGNVNRSYRQSLGHSKSATQQAAALTGYSGAVTKVVDRFRRLGPPPALRPWQRSQVQRLQDIATTGHNLANALLNRDRKAVPPLIKRFRFLLAHQPNVSQAQHDAVKAYDNRLVTISKLQGKIAREHQRLQTLLG